MKRGTGLSETCSTLATVARQKAEDPHQQVSREILWGICFM